MTSSEKRNETLKRKLLELVRQFPGTLAGNIPTAQRRFLRELEKAGFLKCKVEHNEFRWYAGDEADIGNSVREMERNAEEWARKNPGAAMRADAEASRQLREGGAS